MNLIFRIDIKEFKSLTLNLIQTVSEWTEIKYDVTQGSIFGPLLFLVYINNLPKAVEHKALAILSADDTSILLTGANNTQMQSHFNIIFEQLIKRFKSNLLFLNFGKTCFIQFANKSTCTSDIQITYQDKQTIIVN